MKETKTVLFRVQSSGKQGHESNETLKKKLEDYRNVLKKDYTILEEKEVQTRRGSFIEIIYE